MKKLIIKIRVSIKLLILVCIAGPANTYFRYAQPFIFSLPTVLFLLYVILDKKKRNI